MKRIGKLGLFALAAAVASCGGSDLGKPKAQIGAHARAQAPTTLTVHSAKQNHGALEMQAEGETSWRAYDAAAKPAKVRATGKGAMFDFGPQEAPLGRVWLRGGAEMSLSRDADGMVHAHLAAGQARIAMTKASTRAVVHTATGTAPVANSDSLLSRDHTGVHVTATNDAPTQALWSYNVETGQLEPAGIGNLEVKEGKKGKHLELRRLLVDAKTAGDQVVTEVEHVFYNPKSEWVEGTFRFPMPEGAMLLGLSMEINGKMMHGELVEKHKARRVYESIVDEMLDPALLEWEQGRWFKLRVFPIEGEKEKRVVLRYAVPLSRAVHGYEYAYATATPALQRMIPKFRMSFNGKVVASHDKFVAGRDVVVPVPRTAVPTVTRETKNDTTYTYARVTPPWLKLIDGRATTAKRAPRSLVIVFDTSRSSLEGRALSLQTLRTLLDDLAPTDEFVVLASDVTTRAHAAAMQPANAASVKTAVDFVTAIDPDGASDVGLALTHAGKLARAVAKTRSVDVVYLGDGTPTWGITDTDKLADHASRTLGRARLHGALIGKGASTDTWGPLVGKLGGRVAAPRTLFQARRFAFLLARSTVTPRLDSAKVTIAGKTTFFPTAETTLFLGDTLGVVMETPKGEPVPTSVTLSGRFDGKAISFDLPLTTPVKTTHVARRFAAHKIAFMEKSGADKADIVKLSTDFGVMSRHTSFLVLESEDAYKKYKIKRRNELAKKALAKNNAPKVTGGDLRSLQARSPSLSPDEFQPGDPEIRIPAPADARSVIAVFPFGVTKVATWDDDQQVWLVRFLIDKETSDGKYEVRIRITHADGRIQTLRLPYVVDTKPPKVKVRVKKRGSRYTIYVDQIASVFEMKRITPNWTEQSRAAKREAAVLARDIAHVEVQYPDGQTRLFRKSGPGAFYRVWRPRTALTGPVTVRIVVTDRARNQSVIESVIDPGAHR